MSKFSERLKMLRNLKSISQQKLADYMGVSKSSINMYERGEREPNLELLEAFADFFNVDLNYLLGQSDVANSVLTSTPILSYSNVFPIDAKKLPMLGKIACGEPIYASEDKESYVVAGTNLHADFCLKAQGDSMINARIHDGDIVFIRRQPMVENGEIAAVIIGDEATLKRVYYNSGDSQIILSPENPAYAPIVYTGEQLNNIKILGKAIAFQSDIQ